MAITIGDCLRGKRLGWLVLGFALFSFSACQGAGSVGGGGSDAPVDLPSVAQSDAGFYFSLEAGSTVADGCVRTSLAACTASGAQYCGQIGDNCGGTIDCGTCAVGQVCANHMCGGGQDCDAGPLTSCEVTGGRYCGTIGNRCGGALECGECPAGKICDGHICKGGPTCAPVVCGLGADKYCGIIGDTCGNALDCQGCPTGRFCSGNQCIPVGVCTALSCTPPGGTYCGRVATARLGVSVRAISALATRAASVSRVAPAKSSTAVSSATSAEAARTAAPATRTRLA